MYNRDMLLHYQINNTGLYLNYAISVQYIFQHLLHFKFMYSIMLIISHGYSHLLFRPAESSGIGRHLCAYYYRKEVTKFFSTG